MRTILAFILSVSLFSGISGCNIINPSEVVPTYIQIDSVGFKGEHLGASTRRITNVWVYYNNSPVGNFDLPARFPVMATEPGMLTVAPGIYYDGFSSIPVIYPLYLADSLHFSPQPGQVINFKAETDYNKNVGIKYEEKFETGVGKTPYFDSVGGDTVMLNTTLPSHVLYGTGAGLLALGAGQDSAIVLSGENSLYPIIPGRDTYIELDYMGTLTLRVGMFSNSQTYGEYREQLVGLNPRATWGKIYIGVREWIAKYQSKNGNDYRILLRVDKPDGVSPGYMLVDNVRLVSF